SAFMCQSLDSTCENIHDCGIFKGASAMRVWKLEIEYEGTRYGGWQRQPHARTVQGELTKAAAEFFGAEMEVGGSGRTDAGVHALRQVAHLKLKGKAKSKESRERSPSA